MPGTDAGSAPQESWHGAYLKPAFGQGKRKPAEVARILEERSVAPQLRALSTMRHDGVVSSSKIGLPSANFWTKPFWEEMLN